MSKTIISYEAACSANGARVNNLPDFSMLPEPQRKYLTAILKLDAITKALNNEGQEYEWIPNYEDWNERKYVPYFELSSGGVWSSHVFDFWHTLSLAGARPYRTSELAKFAGTHFVELYQDILNYTTK